MRRLVQAFVLVLGLASAAAAQEPEPKKPDPQDRTAELQKEVTAFRGLKYTAKVNVGEYSRDELVAFLKKELERELPKDFAEKWRKALVHFGIFPADTDLFQSLVDLYSGSVAGFYHPKTKELRLIKGLEGEELEPPLLRDITLVHELTHAAQDQNFDLDTLPLDLKTNDDIVFTVQALVEGDATLVGLKWGLKDEFEAASRLILSPLKAGQLGEGVARVPAYLRKSLAFSYGYGTEFVMGLLSKSKDDWSAVSRAFADLPGSTEQILHPDKYTAEARDYPQDIAIEGLEAIVADDWKQIYHNVHGEFGTRLVLDEFKVESSAARRRAAEGWDGDRYFVFEGPGGSLAGAWYSTWDTEDDAKEFQAAYTLVLEAKHEKAERGGAEQKVTFTKGAVTAVLERRGSEVLVLDGFGAGPAGRINKIWTAAKKTEVRKVERMPKEKK